MLTRMYRRVNDMNEAGQARLEAQIRRIIPTTALAMEWCFYIETSAPLSTTEVEKLSWLLGETFDPEGLREAIWLPGQPADHLEIGPRLNFETPWGSTARTICHAIGLTSVTKLERSRRLWFEKPLETATRLELLEAIHDQMTEMVYPHPLESLESGLQAEPVRTVPVVAEGVVALRQANQDFGLAMDEHDLDKYHDLFARKLGRDATDVELFQLGQGNSEHSRHGFFKGNLVIDGIPVAENLMDIVKAPWKANPNNSKIAFGDDSSAIAGGLVHCLVAKTPGMSGPLEVEDRVYHPTLTAETHNHPTMFCPYCGAATGGGGRIRDNQCAGCGALVLVSGVGFCVGNLRIPGYVLPWEQDDYSHPEAAGSPLEILIDGVRGAWDYGNCFGEPVILGHVRSFGLQTPDGYRSWFKPIMYSEGSGLIDEQHIKAGDPEAGMLIVQVGGPAYRIGVGGGSASSLLGGENSAELDFNSVQRGDPEMEQRMNRVIRACVEMGADNPIVSAHDLGAGGDCNALPELVYPVGGRIDLRAIPVGDSSLSVLEIWGNEAQERNALLMRAGDLDRFVQICQRENVPVAVVGVVTDDGNLVVFDSADGSIPVNLPLKPILGETSPKTIHLESEPNILQPMELPEDITVRSALERVLRTLSVGSKSWLTRGVDRSVTGLVAQQQCVGPNHLPLSNFAAVAHSHFGVTGTALSQGERPYIGLINPAAQGRMAVAEAFTNLMGACITDLGDARCSANWMWAAKLPGEGVRLREAALAMRDIMLALGTAVDGGKDSLSMASKDGDRIVKAPGQLVIAPYAVMPDVTCKVTPELKSTGNQLLFIDLSLGLSRLGGSTLGQVYQQLGAECPDVDDVDLLKRAFVVIQQLIRDGQVASLHDRSDGGLVTTLLEMAFAGNFGIDISLSGSDTAIPALFNEELGLVLECSNGAAVMATLQSNGIEATLIGQVGQLGGDISIAYNGEMVLDEPMVSLRRIWDETSSELELLQSNPACVAEEIAVMGGLTNLPNWRLSFIPEPTLPGLVVASDRPKVAVLREAGTNGDREMAAAFWAAGFEVWDVTMSDLLAGTVKLSDFRGVAFAGGFSFGDVLDSAKGWAAVILFNPILREQFDAFYTRPDTFSFGPCNGAQLMALLGWVPSRHLPIDARPRFVHNTSGRFESRFSTVEVMDSPAVMLAGMAGTRMGIWVAHGEGRLHVPNPVTLEEILEAQLAPIRYVDPDGQPTTLYPFNPNGSPHGITALCSADGRHLAMMPHPERLANQLWQWPWMHPNWADLDVSPWLRMFQNAYAWCNQ